MMVEIKRAQQEDAGQLTNIAKKSFLDDNKLKPANANMEGPPGHDNAAEQKKWIQICYFYKAICNNKIVGGGLAWEKNDDEFCIDGMYIDPDFHNKGIGSKLIETILNNHFPNKKWVLCTPDFAKRIITSMKNLVLLKSGRRIMD